MDKLNYEILSAIDNIETTVMESEMCVMNSLIDSYEKAVMILECCNDNVDASSFDIFQESVIMEADDVNKTGKPKKSVKEIILDILSFIPRMIKKGYNIIKNMILNLIKKIKNKRSGRKIINEIKQTAGDDMVAVEINPSTTNAGGVYNVSVTTASHDTQKEEQIKSTIESAMSSNNINITPPITSNKPVSNVVNDTPPVTPTPNKPILNAVNQQNKVVTQPQPATFNNKPSSNDFDDTTSPITFTPDKYNPLSSRGGNPTPSPQTKHTSSTPGVSGNNDVSPSKTTVKINQDDVKFDIHDETPKVDFISETTKNIGDLFTTIDISRMGEPKYNQEFAKNINNIINTYDSKIKQIESPIKPYSGDEYFKYVENLISKLGSSITMIERCSDTLEKSIMLYKNKNKLNNMPEKAIKGESGDIIKSINMMKKFLMGFMSDIKREISSIESTTELISLMLGRE